MASPNALGQASHAPAGDDSSMMDSAISAAEDSMAQRLAHPVPNVRMLQMENAALIDGLRALNEQVKKLEEDRNRLIETGSHPRSVASQEMVDSVDPHSWPTQGSGEGLNEGEGL